MPQAIWSGPISFGLVSVPVRLFPATRRKDVRFREIDRQSGQRIHHERVIQAEPRSEAVPPAASEVEPVAQLAAPPRVPASEVVRGFEVAPNRYVTIEREDLAELAPEQTRTIDIEQFVDVTAVDLIHYDRSY